jgi:mannose/cellobiose epimerase-like protein (N-acyl-D-glucosamine 2-epimerase family)
LAAQLCTKALPWWSEKVDSHRGGYLLSPDEKQLATQSRMAWAFSHAHRKGLGDYLGAAEQGVAFLLEHFRDPKHEGFFWKTDLSGRVRSDSKILYGHAFVLYALVEYFRASGDGDALDEARTVFEVLLERAHDDAHGGWLEHFRRSWRPIRRPGRHVEVEVGGLKSANTHLHVMEALSELYVETGDQAVGASLAETVDVSTTHFYPEDPSASSQYRARDWGRAGRPGVSYGHNVEFAWLLLDAVKALGGDPSWSRFDSYLSHALAAPQTERVWWVEAETLAALTIAVSSRPQPRYLEALESLLEFLLTCQIDPVDGIWLHTVAADGSPVNPAKVGTWKDAYHELRASVVLAEAFGPRTPESRED